MKSRISRFSWIMIAMSAAACIRGNESAFEPAGPQAGRISSLWWYMVGTAAIVWIIVVIALLYATWRGHHREVPDASDSTNKQLHRPVEIAAGITVVILLFTLVYSVTTGNALASLPRDKALRIHVTGHQWWWQADYVDPVAARQVSTANEIHIPVGEPVQIIGSSADVIHSFWIPELAGKKDLIPGHTTALWIQADKPGIYRGQCAEFCGHQHANMALLVMAEPRAEFNAWYNSQLLPAAPPSDANQLAGQKVFMSKGCPLCHTIGGTPALGRVGPPLTHAASNYTIAAGTLKNTTGNLAGWIVDPQGIKPGVRMPANDLSGVELRQLLAYLGSLK
jgi:cytochrome c oxidase subunit 2